MSTCGWWYGPRSQMAVNSCWHLGPRLAGGNRPMHNLAIRLQKLSHKTKVFFFFNQIFNHSTLLLLCGVSETETVFDFTMTVPKNLAYMSLLMENNTSRQTNE